MPALQTEVAARPTYDGSPSMQGSIAAFAAPGFAIADMFLIFADAEERVGELDCPKVRDRPPACPA